MYTLWVMPWLTRRWNGTPLLRRNASCLSHDSRSGQAIATWFRPTRPGIRSHRSGTGFSSATHRKPMISVQNRCETSRLRTLRTMWLMERGGSAWAGGVGTCASSFSMVSSMDGSLPPIASGQLRNHPPWRAAGGDTQDVVEAVPEPRRPILPRRPCGMRCERDVRQREEGVIRRRWLLDHHVEPGARDLPFQQRPVERGL